MMGKELSTISVAGKQDRGIRLGTLPVSAVSFRFLCAVRHHTIQFWTGLESCIEEGREKGHQVRPGRTVAVIRSVFGV